MSSTVVSPHGPLDSFPHSAQLPSRSYRFGDVEVDFQFAEVRRAGRRIRIQDQPLHILAALLSRPGDIVSREELRKLLWDGETFVDFDHCLNSAVKRLRDVLHDDPDHPRLIETIPRHGYRFIAPVTEIASLVQGSTAAHDDAGGRLRLPGEGLSAQPGTGGARRPRAAHVLLILFSIVVATASVSLLLHNSQARAHTTANQSKITIAVLPFHDLSENGSGSSMAAGITQELITQLHKMDHAQVGVVADAPVGQYRFGDKSAVVAAKDLKADYVVEGSTRVQGSAVRIAVQLVRVGDQSYVWAESYDKALGDALAAQQDVAGAVTRVVGEKLSMRKPAGN